MSNSFTSVTQVRNGQPNLAKLLKRTKAHPNGRVQLDEHGEVSNPKNPTTSNSRTIVRANALGLPVEVTIPENSGHVVGDNSVWRIAMHQPSMEIAGRSLVASSPQEMYHKMTELYLERCKIGKSADDFRPNLTDNELFSYQSWLKKPVEETIEESEDTPVTETSLISQPPKKLGRPFSK